MPIKGINDATFTIPRLGKIRLGIKSEKGYPQKVDYFVCPPEVQKVFGEKPKALNVLIPTEDIDEWCPAFYKSYTRTRGLVCKGDGERCLFRMVDTTTGEMPTEKSAPGNIVRKTDLTCEGRECPYYKGKKCTEIANVQVILPDVAGLGVYQIDTTSINTMRHLINEATLMQRMFGRISNIPMTLTLEPEEGIAGETQKKERWYCLHLRTTVTLAQLATEGRKSVRQYLITPPDESEGYAPGDLPEISERIDPYAGMSEEEKRVQAEKDITTLWGDMGSASERKPPVAGPEGSGQQSPGDQPKSNIDTPWLNEQLGIIQKLSPDKWSDAKLQTWLATAFQVSGQGASPKEAIYDAIGKLDKDQATQFCKVIQQAAETLQAAKK